MKRIIFVLSLLFIISVSGLGFIYFSEGKAAFSTKMFKISEKHQLAAHHISQLAIESGVTDVSILPHNEEYISIELKGEVSEKMKDAYELEYMENNESLQITLKRIKRPAFTIFAINKGVLLTIKVPDKKYHHISVENTSGDLAIEHISAQNLHLTSSSGDMNANHLSSEVINLTSTSGDIIGNALLGKTDLVLQSTSGDITIDNLESSSFSLDYEATSGEGIVDIPGFQFKEKLENRIVGKKGLGELAFYVKTKSGDFQLK